MVDSRARTNLDLGTVSGKSCISKFPVDFLHADTAANLLGTVHTKSR
jgi:hypothetical protein